MANRVTYVARYFLWAIRGQKKHRRQILGLLKPVRCRNCRLFTRQVRIRMPWSRKCLACHQIIGGRAAGPAAKPAAFRWPWNRVAL